MAYATVPTDAWQGALQTVAQARAKPTNPVDNFVGKCVDSRRQAAPIHACDRLMKIWSVKNYLKSTTCTYLLAFRAVSMPGRRTLSVLWSSARYQGASYPFHAYV